MGRRTGYAWGMKRFLPGAEAAARTRHTIHAAEVLHDRARAIARACGEAHSDEVVVAVVERNGVFGGAWPIPRAQLGERIAALDDGGWTLVFAPGTLLAEVEARCLELARLAFRRWEALRRWAGKNA